MKKTIKADMITSNVTLNRGQSGFTLIELMVTVSILAIVASIAIPSYSKHIVRNLESESITEIKLLEVQLEKWKASRLTYKGFIPNRGPDVCTGTNLGNDFCFDDTANTTIYVPKGSTSTDYVYKIEILDSAGGNSLVSSATNIMLGRDWYIFSEPNPNGRAKEGFRFLLNNTGSQCKTKDPNTTSASGNCGVHSTTEQW